MHHARGRQARAQTDSATRDTPTQPAPTTPAAGQLVAAMREVGRGHVLHDDHLAVLRTAADADSHADGRDGALGSVTTHTAADATLGELVAWAGRGLAEPVLTPREKEQQARVWAMQRDIFARFAMFDVDGRAATPA